MLSEKIGDASICRRMLFATSFLPKDYPYYWKAVGIFATLGMEKPRIKESVCRVLIENVEAFSPKVFVSDSNFIQEIVEMKLELTDNHPIGIVLISRTTLCPTCQSTMCTRADRLSCLTLYTTNMGTLHAMHYHKICSNRKCKTTQHYGYTTTSVTNSLCYDEEYASLPYFISSQETAFEMDFLHHFDAELLIGQISYTQKAEIYNYYYEYPSTKKHHSTHSRKELTTAPQRLIGSQQCNSKD